MKIERKTEAVSSDRLSVSNWIPYLFPIVGVISSPFASLLFSSHKSIQSRPFSLSSDHGRIGGTAESLGDSPFQEQGSLTWRHHQNPLHFPYQVPLLLRFPFKFAFNQSDILTFIPPILVLSACFV